MMRFTIATLNCNYGSTMCNEVDDLFFAATQKNVASACTVVVVYSVANNGLLEIHGMGGRLLNNSALTVFGLPGLFPLGGMVIYR